MENNETKEAGNQPNQPSQPNQPNQTPNKKRRFNFMWIYVILFAALIGVNFFGRDAATPHEDLDQGKLIEMLKNEEVGKIELINKEDAEIYLNQKGLAVHFPEVTPNTDGFTTTANYTYRIGSLERFEEMVENAQQEVAHPVYITNVRRNNWMSDILAWVLPFGLFIVFWIVLMRGMGRNMGGGAGSIFNIGKSRAQLYDKNTSVNVTFKDVAGLEEAKIEIMEVVDFLKNPEKYTKLGGKIPKGVLLVGPPGTGKTLLAKSVAGEANVPFFSLSGSDFVEMFVGVGASRVRDLFNNAKSKSPCIIFIDEIDAIGRARGKSAITGGNDERESTLNQLLTEMDGFGTNNGVIVMAATNRADILDRALLRAGRFDRQIYVELPDIDERKAIFEVHMKGLKLGSDIDKDFLSKQTPGFSGADIANVCNEAALVAARKNKQLIEKQDFLDAIDRIIGGLEKRSKVITTEEKRTIAFHESGHASVSWQLRWGQPLVKVTIVPRGKALGAAWYLPEERQITTYEQMFDEITSLVAGRAAEEIVFGQISTGALNDLERATKMAFSLVAYYGMSPKVGNISYYDSTGQSEWNFTKPFSEHTNETIDSEVKRMVEEAYQRAKSILLASRDKLDQLANVLFEREVIFREDVENIYGPREWDKKAESEEQKAESEERNKNEDTKE